MSDKPIHPAVRIGHVHLKVADLERALGFYRDVLGFEVTQRLVAQAAFLAAGGLQGGRCACQWSGVAKGGRGH